MVMVILRIQSIIALVIFIATTLIICSAQYEYILPQDCQENYCYDLDVIKEHRKFLGTKTQYPRYTDFDVNREFTVSNCNPKKMWLLVRHGARGPTQGEMEQFRRLFDIHDQFLKHYEEPRKRHKCNFCDLDIQLLKNWSMKGNITNIKTDDLQPQGFLDMMRLAKNLQKMFPTLFEPEYSELDYLFQFSRHSRTKNSYKSFVESLFGPNALTNIKPQRSENGEMLLNAYDHCKDSVKNSDAVDEAEPRKFEKTDEFIQLIRDVSFKLGFKTPLSLWYIKEIWDWCGYEQSWSVGEPSPWCAVFSPSHYPLLDYREDISYYYKKSYGSNVNLKLACHTINDMLYHLDNNDTFKVVSYFVHSTLMQLFLTAMDAFKDEDHLRADNYHKMHNRQFRSSRTLPLSSNLAAIKYECSDKSERDQILFLLNQKPVKFDWCDDSGLCSLTAMKRKYAHFAAMDCDESYCDPKFEGFEQRSSSDYCGLSPTLLYIYLAVLVKIVVQTLF